MYGLTLIGPVISVIVAYMVARTQAKINRLHDCLDQYHQSNVERLDKLINRRPRR